MIICIAYYSYTIIDNILADLAQCVNNKNVIFPVLPLYFYTFSIVTICSLRGNNNSLDVVNIC